MVRALRLLLALVAAGLAAPQGAAAADSVLVVGDSLEVGTGPHLKRELPGVAVAVDARIGRPSGEAVGVLRKRLAPEHDVVVFDIGVNDNPSRPEVLAADLAAARRLGGDRCLVVATMERPPLNGVSVAGLNGAVEEFAQRADGVQVVDWHAAVKGDPRLLNPDRLHPTPDGYAVRGRLVAEGVQSCLADSGAAPPDPKLPAADDFAVEDVPRRPLLVNWATVARAPPVGGLLGVLTNGAGVVAGAEKKATGAVVPAGPEPVLGGG